ncbi:PadR family transcriptional regulator [Sphingobium herbicidovorans]
MNKDARRRHGGHAHFAAMGGRHGRHGEGHGPFGAGPGPFGGGSMRGGGGGRGGRRRLFSNDSLQLILLHLLSETPRHGYDLIREIESRSGEAYAPSPGVVYPTLTMLADMDLIAEQPGAGSRKLFAISEAGRVHLSEHADALKEAMERLTSLAQQAEQVDGAPIRRAMHNLSIAVRARLEREGADRETMFDVASLIDEAASKIERL